MTPTDTAAFFGIVVTLGLGAYNAVQNYRTGRRAAFINTVTAERVKWIAKVRESVASFSGLVSRPRFPAHLGSSEEWAKVEEIEALGHLIALQLNPQAPLDRAIQTLVGQMALRRRADVPREDLQGEMEELIRLTQQMLKAEWDKVKEEALLGDLSGATRPNARLRQGHEPPTHSRLGG